MIYYIKSLIWLVFALFLNQMSHKRIFPTIHLRNMRTTNQTAFTSKKENLGRIKRLHIKCGFLDTEHLFMIPINLLNHREVPDGNVKIVQNFYNAYSTPKSFFVEKDFDSWDPKIHGSRNYLQGFNLAALVDKFGTTKHYPLEMFQKFILKSRDNLLQAGWTMELLCQPLILQLHLRNRKIYVPHLKSK